MADNNQVQTADQNAVEKKKGLELVDSTLQRIQELQNAGGIVLPSNYSAENALRFAWLAILELKNKDGVPALDACTRESVANALLNMVLSGLTTAKGQGYFIVYGPKLMWQRSYQGTMVLAKRVGNVKEVRAVPVYEGDKLVFEVNTTNGRKNIKSHEQLFENMDIDKLVGAYVIVTLNDDSTYAEIMKMKQIRKAWNMGYAKGNSPAHQNFPDEMACKTVIGRALKLAIGSSDDSSLYDDEDFVDDVTAAGVKAEIKENANKEQLSIKAPEDHAEEIKSEPVKSETIKAEPVKAESNGHDESEDKEGQEGKTKQKGKPVQTEAFVTSDKPNF